MNTKFFFHKCWKQLSGFLEPKCIFLKIEFSTVQLQLINIFIEKNCLKLR